MINRAVIMGRLTAQPEVKKTQSGKSVCNITVACQRNKEEVDFIPVVFWDQPAEYLSAYANKGDTIGVEGRISVRKYTDANGNNRTVTEIVADNVQLGGGKRGEFNTEDLPY